MSIDAALIPLCKAGDPLAWRSLVSASMPMIRAIRRSVLRRSRLAEDAALMLLEDLDQLGRIALIEAVERYDEAESSFEHYAGYWIRKAITEYVAESKSPVTGGLSSPQARRALKAIGAGARTREDVMATGQVGHLAASRVLETVALTVLSLDEPDACGSLQERIPSGDPSPEASAVARLTVQHLLSTLDADVAEAVVARHVDETPLEDIGATMGKRLSKRREAITGEAARQAIQAGIVAMRKSANAPCVNARPR